ncbi:MAG: phosphatase PAP2 family protein [Planctomycetota bacterium]
MCATERAVIRGGGSCGTAGLDKASRLVVLAVLLLVAAAGALAVDCPLARWCVDDHCPRFFGLLFGVCEPFGNGLGVLVIVLAVYVLDPRRRAAVWRLLTMSLGAGLAANVVKMLVVRIRPHKFDFQGTVQDTFGQWLPLVSAGSGRQSFPSAHTATAVGLAVALSWLYPRGRWLFAAFAVMVACQRMERGAHYLSDTLCGAAIGCLVATACLKSRWLTARFDRLEQRHEARFPWTAESAALVEDDGSTVVAAEDQNRPRAA